MIYTLTFNPSLDYDIYSEKIVSGEVNRVSDTKITFGGKGINVSAVLNTLGVPNVALGFAGGFSGKELKRLLDQIKIRNRLIDISPEQTRINVKLHSISDTDINAAGPKIGIKHLTSLKNLLSLLKSGDTLCVCGCANGVESFKEVLSVLKPEVRLAADCTGEYLKEAVKHKPFLIKPNEFELNEYFNTDAHGEDELITLAIKLRSEGAENILVSRGEKGMLLVCSKGVYRADALKGTVLNTVGAGDSAFAGFLYGFDKTGDEAQALKFALSCASAAAFSRDLPSFFDMRKYLGLAEIEKLSN